MPPIEYWDCNTDVRGLSIGNRPIRSKKLHRELAGTILEHGTGGGGVSFSTLYLVLVHMLINAPKSPLPCIRALYM